MRLLFITSTRIGDAVLSTGLLNHLLERHPAARVTVACGPQAAPLFAGLPNLERVIPMQKGRHALHWRRLWRAVWRIRWDMVVDLRGSALPWLLRAGERHLFRPAAEPVHRVRQLADLFDLAEPPMPRLWTSAEHDAEAARLIPADRPVLALGPTTNWRAKTWRAENFVALAERLTGPDGILPNARIAVFGAPEERPAAEPVLDGLPGERLIDLVGRLDLLTAYACLERCALYVGNDSALMHLAAAAGIPVVGLFGPSPEANYAPWGWRAVVVRTPQSYATIFPENFDHRASDSLMDGLTVDAAEAGARRLWARVQEGRA